MLKACVVCGTPSEQARCRDHRIERDASGRTRARHRKILIERDGDHCARCGGPGPFQLDHAIPLADNGPDTVENKRLLCLNCHSGGRRLT